VSITGTLCFVLAAVYGLISLLLSFLVAGVWGAGFGRTRSTSGDLLALRLLPSAGAAFLTLTVALPAFVLHEPYHEAESVGPLLVLLAMFTLGTVGHGLVRGWRASAAAALLLRDCGRTDHHCLEAGQNVEIVDVPEPMVAVVGAWRPRVVAARGVLTACSDEEFRQVVAHEAAHVSARDNLKLLLLLVSPDALAWMPAGDSLLARWRAAAECEADARASGADPYKRVALASALIKVARLSSGSNRRFPVLSMPIALDDVDGRVRRLLAPLSISHRALHLKAAVASALMMAILVVPLYGRVQELLEALVAFGR
jgi:Peptidase family M48